MEVNAHSGQFTVDGTAVREGDVISIDGTSGKVYLGEVPVQPSPVVRYFETGESGDETLVAAVDRVVRHADAKRRLGGRDNAATPEDAARARGLGGSGTGL